MPQCWEEAVEKSVSRDDRAMNSSTILVAAPREVPVAVQDLHHEVL